MRDATAILAAIGKPDADGSRVLVSPIEGFIPAMTALKALGDFILLDIDAVDRPEGYDLAYRLLDRGGEGEVGVFTVRLRADKTDPKVPSICGFWKAADVLEREVWDLMGIVFEGREGQKRILCRDDFEGHPLRKDFVLSRTPRFAEKPAGGES